MCIKFIKYALKKCFEINNDAYIDLLEIAPTPLGPGLPSHVALPLNCPITGIIQVPNRASININNDDDHSEALIERQDQAEKNNDTLTDHDSIQVRSIVTVQ